MLQTWMKSVALLVLSGVLFSACRKSEFSDDAPLPETFGPLVYVTSQNNFLYALDPQTGNKRWELKLPLAGLQANPVVIGDYLYLAMDSLYKIDAKRGKIVRRFDKPYFSGFYTTPYADGNVLYLGSTNDTLYAFDVSNENINWKFKGAGDFSSAPTVIDGQILIGNSSDNLYAIDKNAGTRTWTFSAGTTGNQFLSSPTTGRTSASKPTVYACGTDGKLYALDISTGAKKWEYATGAPITSSPIAYGGNVVFGSYDYYVYCIDTIAKKERWKFKTGDRVLCSPYGEYNTIYVGSLDYNFYALDIIDGTEKWKFTTKALIKSSPLVTNGTVYMGSFDKYLYAIDTSGKLKWSHNTNGLIESSPVLWDLTNTYYPSTSGMSKY